jgi:Tat protein secretion system quality control protein TatD with DNase activity
LDYIRKSHMKEAMSYRYSRHFCAKRATSARSVSMVREDSDSTRIFKCGCSSAFFQLQKSVEEGFLQFIAVVQRTLRKHKCASSAVLHWFSGTQRQLAEAVELGCWFSVGPAMLRSEKGRRLVQKMPRNRVLTETDGPFAQEGNRPLEPRDVGVALEHLGVLWAVDYGEANRLLRSNLTELLAQIPA